MSKLLSGDSNSILEHENNINDPQNRWIVLVFHGKNTKIQHIQGCVESNANYANLNNNSAFITYQTYCFDWDIYYRCDAYLISTDFTE